MTSETVLTIHPINAGSVAARTDRRFADIIRSHFVHEYLDGSCHVPC